MSKKEIARNDKRLQQSDSNKVENTNKKKSNDLHRPEYQMVVKQKLEKSSILLLLAIYTIGVIFVTLHFSKGSCS